ncbi:MAG: MerR family transcriptional regulator [Candidatus Omnitrophota bacterium]
MKVQTYFTPVEVAAMLHISKQTLVRYEKKGVFPKPKRHPINKWREYTEEDIGKLKRILRQNV